MKMAKSIFYNNMKKIYKFFNNKSEIFRKQNFGVNPNKYKYIIETQTGSGQISRFTVRASQIW
jgi:hypothetical protein